jgi:hypothetical protein
MAGVPESLAAGSDEIPVQTRKAGALKSIWKFGILLPGDCPGEPGKRVRQF